MEGLRKLQPSSAAFVGGVKHTARMEQKHGFSPHSGGAGEHDDPAVELQRAKVNEVPLRVTGLATLDPEVLQFLNDELEGFAVWGDPTGAVLSVFLEVDEGSLASRVADLAKMRGFGAAVPRPGRSDVTEEEK